MAFSLTSTGLRLDGTILRARCKTDNGKLVDSALDLNLSISNNEGNFRLPGGMFGASATDILLNGSILHAVLSTSQQVQVRRLIDLNVCIGNINGTLTFLKPGGRFDSDGPVRLSFDIAPFTRSVVNGLHLLAGNDVWAERVATFCSNSPIICVTLVLGAFFGGPLGAVISAGIITPIGLAVESAIAGVINDPILKGKYEEAVVGDFICDTISHMLVDGGAELLAEAVGTLAGLDVETAVAEVRGVFRGAKVEVAELGSYRLLEKFVGAVFEKETPKDWLETREKVGKLGQA